MVSNLHALAMIGAKIRLDEIHREEAVLLKMLKGLNGNGVTANVMPAQASDTARRHHVSAQQRKAISQRMKKYWAARRKTESAQSARK